jgi:phage terminase large subunit-like protein
VVTFGQGDVSMNPPMQELERAVLSKKMNHGDNPVLSWMADNLVAQMGPTGLLKPDKAKSAEKIDGITALLMGLDLALRHPEKVSALEKHGVRRLYSCLTSPSFGGVIGAWRST